MSKTAKSSGKVPKSKNIVVPAGVKRTFQLAVKARQLAYAPYSKFQVGAALLTIRGEIISGCNIENASYGGTICAERVAILKAVSEGAARFSDLVVVTDLAAPAFPCALCLQTMAEFFSPDTRVWVANLRGIQSMHEFNELLPKPFGPRQLNKARK